MDPASAQKEVRRIQGRVLAHKKGAARERGRMRRELRKLDEFRAMCAEFGITLIIESDTSTQSSKEQSDDSNDQGSDQAGAGEQPAAG